MDIPVKAEVRCTDGVCGQSTYLVVHPKTHETTHVVVQERHLGHQQRLVPLRWIRETAPGHIDLLCTQDELSKMDPFIETRFVKVDIPKPVGYGYTFAWPEDYITDEKFVPVQEEMVPFGEVAIRKGARVDAQDGHIGRIDELLIDPVTHKITHLVLRKGHLFGQRDVVIPVDQIDLIEEDVVYLKLDRQAVNALPAEPVRQ